MPIPTIERLRQRRQFCTGHRTRPEAACDCGYHKCSDLNSMKDSYVKSFIQTAHTYPYQPCKTPCMELLPSSQKINRPLEIHRSLGTNRVLYRLPVRRQVSIETIAPIIPLWNFSHEAEQSKEALDMAEWLLYDTSAGLWPDSCIREAILTSEFIDALHNAWGYFGYSYQVSAPWTSIHVVDLYHKSNVEPQSLPEWLQLDHVWVRGPIDLIDMDMDDHSI